MKSDADHWYLRQCDAAADRQHRARRQQLAPGWDTDAILQDLRGNIRVRPASTDRPHASSNCMVLTPFGTGIARLHVAAGRRCPSINSLDRTAVNGRRHGMPPRLNHRPAGSISEVLTGGHRKMQFESTVVLRNGHVCSTSTRTLRTAATIRLMITIDLQVNPARTTGNASFCRAPTVPLP